MVQKWTGNTIPDLRPGQSYVPSSCLLHEGQTVPPRALSEVELIDLMNNTGIG